MFPRGRDESFVIVALSPLSRHCRRRRYSIENNINPSPCVILFFYSLVWCAPLPSYVTMKCTVALDKAWSEMFKSVGNCGAIIQPNSSFSLFHHFWRFIQTDFCWEPLLPPFFLLYSFKSWSFHNVYLTDARLFSIFGRGRYRSFSSHNKPFVPFH